MERKHQFWSFLLLSSACLLLLSTTSLSTGNAKYRRHYHVHTKRYVKSHYKKRRSFKYNHWTLKYLHRLVWNFYGVNLSHRNTIKIAHDFYGNHNYSTYRMKRGFYSNVVYHHKRTNKRKYRKYHHYYYRKARRITKRYRHHLTKRQKYNLLLKNASKQSSKFNDILRNQLLRDVNNTRKRFHRHPLRVNLILQQDANYRNNKVQFAYEHPNDAFEYEPNLTKAYLNTHGGMTDGWAHGMDTHTSGYDYLMAHHVSPRHLEWGANCGNWMTGKYVEQPDGTLDKYSDETPRGIANNINDEEIYHDNCDGNHNGHRFNELDPNYRYMGVGVTYNPKINLGTFNEQFSN